MSSNMIHTAEQHTRREAVAEFSSHRKGFDTTVFSRRVYYRCAHSCSATTPFPGFRSGPICNLVKMMGSTSGPKHTIAFTTSHQDTRLPPRRRPHVRTSARPHAGVCAGPRSARQPSERGHAVLRPPQQVAADRRALARVDGTGLPRRRGGEPPPAWRPEPNAWQGRCSQESY